jgi:ferrous iron transport protein B
LKKVVLIGNPNSGKSTLFNLLTGLHQKVGNFPGVTVDKLIGNFRILKEEFILIDLPGTFSINPKTLDEEVVFSVLSDTKHPDFPDLTVLVSDATNLKRSLFLITQVLELGIPCVLVLNMMDLAIESGLEIDLPELQSLLGIKVLTISARNYTGIDEFKEAVLAGGQVSDKKFVDLKLIDAGLSAKVKLSEGLGSDFAAFYFLNHISILGRKHLGGQLEDLLVSAKYDAKNAQRQEAILRYKVINEQFNGLVKSNAPKNLITEKLDDIVTHKVWGLLIFFATLFGVFQILFNLSQWPMEGIDGLMAMFRSKVATSLPSGIFNDLVVEGILAGVTGIVIFIPQIALLFGLIAVLEESGYMARVSFLMDKLMRPFGLNGRSVVPLIGGIACAVPSILAARTIGNRKERLLTILVTPLMSCSARLPVYSLMIALVIPKKFFLGFIGYQGFVLLFLYLIGLVSALLVAFLLSKIVKDSNHSLFVFELPKYRLPQLKSVGLTVVNKIKDFLTEAGGVILAISIVLWFLASFGPKGEFSAIEAKYKQKVMANELDSISAKVEANSEKLAHSFAGILGKSIEPIIKPLGFDWKIGIALVTSFAAREVFVGTMNTIYSVSDSDAGKTLSSRMKSEIRQGTTRPFFDLATGVSLMLFYAFAMQCMSTLAVVKSETKCWKWPVFQFIYMGFLAFAASFISYNLICLFVN